MTPFEHPLPPWQAFGHKKPKIPPVCTGGTARPAWSCAFAAFALLPWARHCYGHCLNAMGPGGAPLCVNRWTGLCQPLGVPWRMKQYPEALQKWLDVFHFWPWKVVARITGDGLCSHHDVVAVSNKQLLTECQPLRCPPGPEEAPGDQMSWSRCGWA